MKSKKGQHPKQPTKELEFQYWPYEDGSIGGCVEYATGEKIPGVIWARDPEAYVAGTMHIMDIFIKHHQHMNKTGERRGYLDMGAEMTWIDNRLVVRWLAVPGFGIDFANEQELETFMSAFFLPPNREGANAKSN